MTTKSDALPCRVVLGCALVALLVSGSNLPGQETGGERKKPVLLVPPFEIGNIEGITIVERQRVNALLVEAEFGGLSGLLDPEKAVKLGKMLGANLIVMGTIIDIHDDVVKFQGG